MDSCRENRFIRPKFSPLPPVTGDTTTQDSINSLPELIRHNAIHNGNLLFCIQGQGAGDASLTITFQALDDAISACSSWVKGQLRSTQAESETAVRRPIALYLESDVGLFIYIAAMLASNIPVVLLSARLSDTAISHLIKETDASTLLVSSRTRRNLTPKTASLLEVVDAKSYHRFLDLDAPRYRLHFEIDNNSRHVLILHSSGTTGLPKPIRLAHRYLLGYAACHTFDESEEPNWRNLSTLPLYHGFGLLAPCLSLSIGMTCCFPPSNTIPAAESSLRMLSLFHAQSLMTVPSILEDVISLQGEQFQTAMTSLATLQFVAVGGGPIQQQVGELLADNSVKLLNHYGATEIGAIASIFKPIDDYDWRYLRLRKDLGLQLRPLDVDGAKGLHKLVGYPCGWGEPFEIQDELELRPQSNHLEVRILRRRDDLIVLKTGEKVAPGLLEEALSKDEAVRTAVCIGSGYSEVVLLVEQSHSVKTDTNALIDHVWDLVVDINPLLDQHARISSKAAIVIKPSGKEIRRSDKGSVMRKEVQEDFRLEIQQAYEALESFASTLILRLDNLELDLADLVKSLFEDSAHASAALGLNDDFFEAGLDSLRTVRLARVINAAVRKTSSATPQIIKPDLIYRNPTIGLLADALKPMLAGEHLSSGLGTSRETKMRLMLSSFLDTHPAHTIDHGAVVLITGSTGSLGVHVLRQLASSNRVDRIICLNRVAHKNGKPLDQAVRQAEANAAAGVSFSAGLWKKIRFLDANTQAPNLGIEDQDFANLATTVTHIVHLAWPMDFKRGLKSFEPHIRGTRVLADLAIAANKISGGIVKPRLLFASSIAVLARYNNKKGTLVPEVAVDDPLVTAPMGYAEAKWVCEQMLSFKARQHPDKFHPIIARVGQLSGAENGGVWKVEEHFPALVKISQNISALPALSGSYSWLPADRAAKVVIELLFQPGPLNSLFYHVENPIRQSNHELAVILRYELGLTAPLLPYDVWLSKVRETGDAKELLEFFEKDFERLSGGTISLSTQKARLASLTLNSTSGVKKELITEYIRKWKAKGFLSCTDNQTT